MELHLTVILTPSIARVAALTFSIVAVLGDAYGDAVARQFIDWV